jgi:hypothetical protein
MKTVLATILAGCFVLGAAASGSALCLTDSDCTDGNVCTGVEHCVSGNCVAGTALNCADNNPCSVDTCDALIGCQHAQAVNGSGCSDGTFCNGNETCQAGVCTAGQALPNGTSCNDGNACTTGDTCQAGACSGSTRPDGTTCSDANPCNGLEVCQGGACQAGQGQSNGSPCGDGNPCNGNETCQSGVCAPGSPLPNGALCTDAFVCNGTETCQNQLCTAGTPAGNGTQCNDGNLCNGIETCQDLACTSGTSLNCNDNNPCTTDTCNPATGCVHTTLADGSSCDDGLVCNGTSTCQVGACTAGAPPPNGTSCADGNPCNGAESCSNGLCAAGSPLPNGTSCSDANVCNGPETCQSGACVDGQALNCVDGNPCTFDNCNPIGGCSNPAKGAGADCDNDDVCDGVASCNGSGQCIPGAPLLCGDQDPGTVDGCDPLGGCTSDFTLAAELLNVRAGGVLRRNVKVKTADILVFGNQFLGNGTSADPVLHGAQVRIVSNNGPTPFDGRFDLPAQNWKYIGDAGENKGYRYKDRSKNAAIRSAQIKSGKPWKVAGRSDFLGPRLDVDPEPVFVHVKLGIQRYCMTFGGETTFVPLKKFRAENAPKPASCAIP